MNNKFCQFIHREAIVEQDFGTSILGVRGNDYEFRAAK
jgi:hypothetical protein